MRFTRVMAARVLNMCWWRGRWCGRRGGGVVQSGQRFEFEARVRGEAEEYARMKGGDKEKVEDKGKGRVGMWYWTIKGRDRRGSRQRH